MNAILVGDPHFGKKNFSEKLFFEQLKFWEVIVKTAKEKNYPIISMGDLFDNRINMDIKFFNLFIEFFIKLLKDNNVTFYNIIGNHDIYYKNTRDINMVKYLTSFYENVIIINEITDIDNLTMVPWIIDNEKDIPKKYNDIVLGHFEFSGVDKYVSGSLDINTFKDAKLVISGHYHNHSQKNNIIYLGTPYQMDWGDYKETKGFYILEGTELTFIENKISKKFIKLKYDENFKKPLILSGYEKNDLYFDSISDDLVNILKNNIFKFFINYAKDNTYQKLIYELTENNLKFEVINNVEISEVIGTDFKEEDIKIENETDILENIPEKYKNLIEEINRFVSEKEK